MRFKLRTFLVGAMVTGVSSGILGQRARYVDHVFRCVPQIEKHGAQVHSDFHQRYGLFPPDRRGTCPGLFEWCLSNPQTVTLLAPHGRSTDESVRQIATLYTVQELTLLHSDLSERGLREVTRLPALESLRVEKSGIGDSSLKILLQCRSLRMLELTEVPITDGGVPYLAAITSLQELRLHNTLVTPRGVTALRRSRPDLRVQLAGDQPIFRCSAE